SYTDVTTESTYPMPTDRLPYRSISNSRRFLVQQYPDHRNLHSFPTRRSSDLTPVIPNRAPLVTALSSRNLSAICGPSIGTFLLEDRKSTRLNSSHLVISYAVFCLKKKNKEATFTHILPTAKTPCDRLLYLVTR